MWLALFAPLYILWGSRCCAAGARMYMIWQAQDLFIIKLHRLTCRSLFCTIDSMPHPNRTVEFIFRSTRTVDIISLSTRTVAITSRPFRVMAATSHPVWIVAVTPHLIPTAIQRLNITRTNIYRTAQMFPIRLVFDKPDL